MKGTRHSEEQIIGILIQGEAGLSTAELCRLTALLTREGMVVNHKRVYRLYREERLTTRIQQRRRIRWTGPAREPVARRPNEKESMDTESSVEPVSTPMTIRFGALFFKSIKTLKRIWPSIPI